MSGVDATRKLAVVAALFAAALGILAVAAVTHDVLPLFFTWIPLLAAAWVLIRPEPGEPLADDRPEREETSQRDERTTAD